MEQNILVVDLDGTVLKSDMLYESFWSAFGCNWRVPFYSILALAKSRAALKDYLAHECCMDVASLPYDREVLDYIKSYRAEGGCTALVTASNHKLAVDIADHLQVFDEVHGSTEENNLKGINKSEFLAEKFGENQFDYMGDSHVDLHVWKMSQKIITVNAPRSLAHKAESFGKTVEHLSTSQKSLSPYMKAMRPYQWLKNFLIFIPMFAAHNFDTLTFAKSIMAFIAFSSIASSVYLLNDLLDLSADRAHPRKRLRPLASGALPLVHGAIMALALLIFGAIISITLGAAFAAIMTLYYALTTLYSLKLKQEVIIDICILAGLYTMRVVAGAIATGISPSFWLLTFSIFFFFSLAAVKRQAELVDMSKRAQSSLQRRGYQVGDLPIISMAALGSGFTSILVFALYVSSPEVTHLYNQPSILWGICYILLYWLTRTVLVTHRGLMHDDPIIYAATDKVSLICFLAIFVITIAATLL